MLRGGTEMNFRFASWNVRNIAGGAEADGLLNLIEKQKPDLLALQEVNPRFHAKLAEIGSFAWSANRGRKGKDVYCRYDFIYATPDISVRKVSYPHVESWDAGSDHSMVVADLELPDKPASLRPE
jgi:exonuclease III